ncbi:unnamed protein product [Phytomonas sp. EM1]|nr:unnamed protein product [Phytomonas sp. EM1]|eukprot:CCW63125.1 unnamed protein product [Phytomonas sp. isolate EM1]
MLNGEVQTVVIAPGLSIVPRPRSSGPPTRKGVKPGPSKPSVTTKGKPSVKAEAKEGQGGVGWKNVYDLQPSPSATFPHSDRGSVSATTSLTERARMRGSDTEKWRGGYWKNVDVHRYIARHYFGEPPKKES